MSSSLRFFSVSWKELSGAIGSHHQGLYRKLLKIAEPIFEEVYEASSFRGGPDLAEGIDRWIQGEVVEEGQTGVRVQSLGDALGFLSLIQYFGKEVGSLEHTSSSFDQFERFLLGPATTALRPPVPLTQLRSRPILGVESGQDALWGGLSREELSALASPLSGDPPQPPDQDDALWMVPLWDSLGSALDLGKDLITIYA
ncbi:MAG TPA: hypothetical protein VE981_04135 [Planctomycetota bacterium]|nr:hypothetical protein [Planctomycetota bacterium]